MDIFQSQRFAASLSGLSNTTERLARVMKSDAIMRKADYAEISRLNDRLNRVIPIIPAAFGIAGATLGAGVDYGGFPPFGLPGFGLPPLFPPLGPPGGGGRGSRGRTGPKGPVDTGPPTGVELPIAIPEKEQKGTDVDQNVDVTTGLGQGTPIVVVPYQAPTGIPGKPTEPKEPITEPTEPVKPGVPARPSPPARPGEPPDEEEPGEQPTTVPEPALPPKPTTPILPPLVPRRRKDDEPEEAPPVPGEPVKEPVTAFIEAAMSVPLYLRFEAFKLIRRVPELFKKLTDYVQSDEYLEVISGRSKPMIDLAEVLNVPPELAPLIEQLLVAVLAGLGRGKGGVPIRTGPSKIVPFRRPTPTPTTRPTTRPTQPLLNQSKPASQQTIDVTPSSTQTTRSSGGVTDIIGGTGRKPSKRFMQDPERAAFESIFTNNPAGNAALQRKILDKSTPESTRKVLQQILDRRMNKNLLSPQSNSGTSGIGPQASANIMIKPIYILTDKIA